MYRMLSKFLLLSAAALSLVGCIGTAGGASTWTATLISTLVSGLSSTLLGWIFSQIVPTGAS